MKPMSEDEFKALPKDQQEQFLANAEALRKNMEAQANDDANKPKLTMKDFEEKVNGIVEQHLKTMSPTDKKFFVMPGIGNDPKLNDDVSPQGKFLKTKRFFQALIGKDNAVLNTMHQEARIKTNLSEGTTTAGGFLVPDEFKAEILRLAPLYGVIRREARIIPMMSDVTYIPRAGSTDITAHWTNEASAIYATEPNFEQVTLTINKLATIPKMSNELLADANVSVINYLAEIIAEKFGENEDIQGFGGTGSPFVGILHSSGVPITNYDATSGGALTLSYADLVEATGNLYSNVLGNAKFYFHRSGISHIRSLITTTGAPIFGLTSDSIGAFPMVGVEALSNFASVSATNVDVGIFGDIRRGYAVGERGTITMKMSEEATVNGDNLFAQDMVALRVIERVAMACLLPSAFTKFRT